jgi:hypothetical protein
VQVAMNNKLVQMIGALSLAVLVVLIWRGDAAAADTIKDVFGWMGDMLQETVERVSGFVESF